MQDGEPADPRVEHPDRAPAQLLGKRALGHAASLARRSGGRRWRAGLLPDAVDRRLELLDHRVGDPLVRERPARLHDARPGSPPRAGSARRTRPSPARPAQSPARPRARDPRVHRAHRLVAHRPSPIRLALPPPVGGAWIAVSGAARDGSTRAVTKACRQCVGSPRCARARRDEHVPDARAAGLGPVRARPGRGAAAARRRRGRAVPLPAGTRNYPRAARELRRRYEPGEFDVVHVHFGLVAWPALLAGLRPLVVTLHGNDLLHPRSRPVTRAALPFMALPAAVSRAFSENIPGAGRTRRVAILPCGVDLDALPPDPARGGARSGSGSTPTARTCCSRTTRRGRSSASTARRRRPATSRSSRSAACPRRRSRTGSTRPTRWSCRPRTRAWGSR